jgi:peptide/nickel transport system ATP-binding protein
VQESRCKDEVPELRKVEGHFVACHWAEKIKAGEIAPKQSQLAAAV